MTSSKIKKAILKFALYASVLIGSLTQLTVLALNYSGIIQLSNILVFTSFTCGILAVLAVVGIYSLVLYSYFKISEKKIKRG